MVFIAPSLLPKQLISLPINVELSGVGSLTTIISVATQPKLSVTLTV